MPDRTPAGEVTGEVLREMREQCRVAAFGTFPAARRISVPHERILALLDAFDAQRAELELLRELEVMSRECSFSPEDPHLQKKEKRIYRKLDALRSRGETGEQS